MGSELSGNASHLSDSPVDWFYGEYALRVREAGGVPVELPAIEAPRDYVGHLDALILTGGGDVDPERWGGPADTSILVSKSRDHLEFGLLEAAIDAQIPILGICRGLQVINVFFGGDLIPHLSDREGDRHSAVSEDRSKAVHPVICEPESIVCKLYGQTAMVNSFHHQAANQPGASLKVSARSPDGTVEALEHSNGKIVGVQWHPEMLGGSQPVFKWLVGAAQ